MPTGTSIQQFINDLRDGKSSIARALDDLFGTRSALERLQSHPNLSDLRRPGALDTPLADWAERELRGTGSSGLSVRGVGDKEIAHINAWDDTQKDKLRAKLADSIDHVLLLKFYWVLTPAGERIDVPNIGSAGNVTFRSPRAKIRTLTGLTGEVTVEV
jgi:hypothetical protein